jgi:ABC-type uncharacterized transport system ATPase subunit
VAGEAHDVIHASFDKWFGTRQVLHAAELVAREGTVHALVGENGAGKSTFVKILAGVLAGDGGKLTIGDETIDLASWTRHEARAHGIGIVQQHGASAGTLTVVENAVLGLEPHRRVMVRGRDLPAPVLELEPTARALAELGAKIGLPVDPHARVDALSLGAAQRAEIVAALHHGARVLILDEPTAVLTPVEVEGLLGTLRKLAADGRTIVIVTHKLDEVRAVADEVTVLRAGKRVTSFAKPVDVGEIARAMVGSDIPRAERLAAPAADAKPALVLANVGVGTALHDVSLAVRAGELVGVAGVDGNGQRELAGAIAGLVAHAGRIELGGVDVSRMAPARRLARGLAHVPEDRHRGGLVLDASVATNLTLARHDITGRFRIDRGRVRDFSRERIAELDIRPPDADAVVRALSGGNQQKVVIGRELSRPGLRAVVAAQPTRGVDLGAVARIHDRLRAAASAGAGVLVISADLDELLSLCHRIVVLLRGRIVGERGGVFDAAARAELGVLMTGAEAA